MGLRHTASIRRFAEGLRASSLFLVAFGPYSLFSSSLLGDFKFNFYPLPVSVIFVNLFVKKSSEGSSEVPSFLLRLTKTAEPESWKRPSRQISFGILDWHHKS